MEVSAVKQPYFGLKGKWLTFWITVSYPSKPPSEQTDTKKHFRKVVMLIHNKVACSTDMSLFGYDQGVFSELHSYRLSHTNSLGDNGDSPQLSLPGGVVITKDYLDVHGLNGPEKTSTLSIITSIYTIGCFLGAAAAFTIGERYGRKKTIVIGTIIMTLGAILQTTSFSVPHMIVGRIITG